MSHSPTVPDSKPPSATLKRRGVLLGTGVAAIAGAAAVVASRSLQTGAPESVAPAARHEADEGYRLSQHVLRYYETARV